LYYIYATASGGVVNAIEADATAYAVSTTAGNKGVVTKIGDDARTLVGMARPITGPAWQDTVAQRFVRSWFNDNGVEQQTAINNGSRPTVASVSPTFVEIAAGFRCETLL
jgi:muramidase (phage lysozyme)